MRKELDRPAEVDWEREKQRVLREVEHENNIFRGIDPDYVKQARLRGLYEQLKTIEEALSRESDPPIVQEINEGIGMRIVLQFLWAVITLLVIATLQLLNYLQDLEYIKVHTPKLYAHLLSPTFTLALLAVAVSFVVLGFLELRKRRATSRGAKLEGFKQETHGEHSPTTGIGSIGIITAGGNIIIGGSLATPSTLGPAPKYPHFEFVGIGFPRYLHISPSHEEGIVVATTLEQQRASVSALTLRFRNVPKGNSESARALNVVGQLRFYSDGWSKTTDIDYGVWLDSSCDCTEMEVGDTRELILLILVDGSRYALQDLRHDINREYEEYLKELAVDWFKYVKVTLVDQVSHTSESWLLQIWNDGSGWCHTVMEPLRNSREAG